jgi:O-antigen/teichoic acid export membrane protein
MRIAAAFALFRAYVCIPDALLRIGDNQAGFIRCMVMAGIVNMGFDIPLILKWGAGGAAVGNGIGQALGVALIWVVAAKQFSFGVSWKAQARFFVAALIPAMVALASVRLSAGIAGLCVAIGAAVPLYFVCLRFLRAFEPTDLEKLRLISDRLPGVLGNLAWKLFRFAVKAEDAVGVC